MFTLTPTLQLVQLSHAWANEPLFFSFWMLRALKGSPCCAASCWHCGAVLSTSSNPMWFSIRLLRQTIRPRTCMCMKMFKSNTTKPIYKLQKGSQQQKQLWHQQQEPKLSWKPGLTTTRMPTIKQTNTGTTRITTTKNHDTNNIKLSWKPGLTTTRIATTNNI